MILCPAKLPLESQTTLWQTRRDGEMATERCAWKCEKSL